MKISKKRLEEIILEEMEKLSKENLNELGGFSHNVNFDITGTQFVHQKRYEKKKNH